MLLLKILMNLMNMSTKKVVFIVGPTAIGKTALSIKLAQHFNTEIISCDSRQFYKEMSIGTAVPSQNDLSRVNHYCIQHKSIFDNYTVNDFRIEALKIIKHEFKNEHLAMDLGPLGKVIQKLGRVVKYQKEQQKEAGNNISLLEIIVVFMTSLGFGWSFFLSKKTIKPSFRKLKSKIKSLKYWTSLAAIIYSV